MPQPERPTGGLTETPYGLRWYSPELHVMVEIADLRRTRTDWLAEVTVKCSLEGVRTMGADKRMRQATMNMSSITTRKSWAKALADMCPDELNAKLQWEQVIEQVCQEVLDHEKFGTVKGGPITGARIAAGGRPWAAYPVLPHRETATIFAKGGSGKTSLVYSLAMGMAIGHSLVPGIRIDRKYRVVILDWETNAETANDTMGLIASSNGIDLPDGIWYEPMDSPLERSMMKIASVIERHRADLVVIDSVSMALVSSSEFSDQAGDITRAYQTIRRLNTWGLLIDHVAGNDTKTRRIATKAYGSVYKINLARHAMTLHVGDRVGDTAQAFLLCPKSNVGRDRWAMAGTYIRNDEELRFAFGDPDHDLYERLLSQSDGEDKSGSGDGLADAEGLATPRYTDKYLALLADHYPEGLLIPTIREELDQSTDVYVRKVLNALRRDGLVMSVATDGKQHKWMLTEQGVRFTSATRPSLDD